MNRWIVFDKTGEPLFFVSEEDAEIRGAELCRINPMDIARDGNRTLSDTEYWLNEAIKILESQNPDNAFLKRFKKNQKQSE